VNRKKKSKSYSNGTKKDLEYTVKGQKHNIQGISNEENFKYLGLPINLNLNFKTTINDITKQAKYQLFKVLTMPIKLNHKLKLIKGMVYPRILYKLSLNKYNWKSVRQK